VPVKDAALLTALAQPACPTGPDIDGLTQGGTGMDLTRRDRYLDARG